MITTILLIIGAVLLLMAAVEFGMAINAILAYPIRVLTRIKPGVTKTSVITFIACVLMLLFINSPSPILSDLQSFVETGKWSFSFESGFWAFVDRYWQPSSNQLTAFTIAVGAAGAFRIFSSSLGYYEKRYPFYEGQSIAYFVIVKFLKVEDSGGWTLIELTPFIVGAIIHLSFGDGVLGIILLMSLIAVGFQYFFEYMETKQQYKKQSMIYKPKSIQYELFD
ncbi:MAG: hypothetical protein RLP12_13055 [Ekhidna sp.]